MEKTTTSSIEKIRAFLPVAIDKITKFRFTILFVILGAALAFALLKTLSYNNIARNEQRYSDESLRIKYKAINDESLNSFSQEQLDREVQVAHNLIEQK